MNSPARTTLYVTDLDGTLLQPDSRISVRSAEMINKAIGQGALFTVATARTPATVAPICAPLHLNLPLIVMTGTALWDRSSGRYSDVKYMNPDSVSRLISIYRRMKCPTFIYTLDRDMIHIYHSGPVRGFEKEFMDERASNPYKTLHIPEHGDSEMPSDPEHTVLFYSIQPDELARATFEAACGVPDVRMQKYYDYYGPETGILEAFSPQSTKAQAIATLAARTGATRIVAFGDNLNDLPMLRMADVGVAVGNAIEEVKAAADVVIGPNTDDSVARFILADMAADSEETC